MKNKSTEKAEKKQDKRKTMKHLFKKGQSGNPKGKKKGTISITTEIKKKLKQIPRGQKKSYLEQFILKVLKKAMVDEDPTMIKLIWNYIDGLPKQSINFDVEESISKIDIEIKTNDKKNLKEKKL